MIQNPFKFEIETVDCALETAAQRNEIRGDDEISAYYVSRIAAPG
jgi:hypothetical protein